MASVVVIAAYFIAWSLLHSLLASLRVKRWARRVLGAKVDRWYRLVFNTISGLTVLPMLAFLALLPDRTLYIVPSLWRWMMVGLQGGCVVVLLWTLLQTDALHFVGLRQLLAKRPRQSGILQIRGMYCYVRHPLYFFSLILIWLVPVMTANLLTLYILIALYFYIGSIHEEARLVDEFGESYVDYQRRVPRLIPRLKRCYPPTGRAGG